MISFLSFGKHKKKKEHEDFSDVFPELNQLKQQIDNEPPMAPFEQPSNTFPTLPSIEPNNREQPFKPPMQQPALPLPPPQPQQPMQPPLPPTPQPQSFPVEEHKQTIDTIPLSEHFEKPHEESKIDDDIKREIEQKPEIYIKIDKYKELLSLLNRINAKLKEIENDLLELKNLKSKELERLNLSRKELEDSKDNIDKVLGILKGF